MTLGGGCPTICWRGWWKCVVEEEALAGRDSAFDGLGGRCHVGVGAASRFSERECGWKAGIDVCVLPSAGSLRAA